MPSSVAVVGFLPLENHTLKYARKVKSSEAQSNCRQISEHGEGEMRVTDSAWQYTQREAKNWNGDSCAFSFFSICNFLYSFSRKLDPGVRF